MGFFDKLKKITSNLFNSFSEADEAFFEELEETLILADLGLETAVDAVEKLRTRVRKEKLRDQEEVRGALRDILVEMYGEAGKSVKRAEAYMIVERRNMVARQKFQDLFRV